MSLVSYCDRHSKYFVSPPGCSSCRAHARAIELASGPVPTADLVAREQALTDRAIQRARASVASIDRALAIDEAERDCNQALRHLEDMKRGLFAALTGQPGHGLRVVR